MTLSVREDRKGNGLAKHSGVIKTDYAGQFLPFMKA